MSSLQVRIDTGAFDRLMVSRGYNCTTLAEQIGTSRTTVSNMRNGRTVPRTTTLARVCEVLGCTPGDIIKEV